MQMMALGGRLFMGAAAANSALEQREAGLERESGEGAA